MPECLPLMVGCSKENLFIGEEERRGRKMGLFGHNILFLLLRDFLVIRRKAWAIV